MFFQKKSASVEKGMHDVNMTPLIDVSLVLVVMLMLATPLALESSIALRKASKSTRQTRPEKVKDRVHIEIVSDDHVTVDKSVVARGDLAEMLPALLRQASRRLVVIECRDGVSHGAFVDVLDQAKSAGASEIAVSGE